MRLALRRGRPLERRYGEWASERLQAAQEFAAELASWPNPVDVMRAAWGLIPDDLPPEPSPRRRAPVFHFEAPELGFLNGHAGALVSWPSV